ncbi:MAG TPA: hypothetical protein VME41_00855, partial [Stellaceae bacterium]|nr:hypothetical protein [Stellaceae bacterium]
RMTHLPFVAASYALGVLLPLLVMAFGFMLAFLWLLLLRMRAALNDRKLEALRLYGQMATAEQRRAAAPAALAEPALR